MSTPADLIDTLTRDGYVLVPGLFAPEECRPLAAAIAAGLGGDAGSGGLRTERRALYGGRNLLRSVSEVRTCWQREAIRAFLSAVLGPRFGLVRALFFDKPPGATWSLAWHRDQTIAVAAHLADLEPFRCPTVKAGVPHLEAPRELLASMLTLRIHLDPVTDENGPLLVMPGSHQDLEPAKETHSAAGHAIHCAAGDVLAMRPLLLHASRARTIVASCISNLPHRRSFRAILHGTTSSASMAVEEGPAPAELQSPHGRSYSILPSPPGPPLCSVYLSVRLSPLSSSPRSSPP